MDAPTYVVYSVGSDDPYPLKHFTTLPAARAFAGQQVDTAAIDRAEIWAIRTTDARAAVAALKMGEGQLVELRAPHASEAELHREREREWKIAVGRGPNAILKFLGLI